MVESSNIWMNPGIFAIAGTILGFLLNQYTANRTEKNQIRTTKTLFELEIDQNLESLKEFMRKIDEFPDSDSDLSSKIISLPFPQLKWIIWKTQTKFLVLSFEKNEIQKFYDYLDSLKSLYLHILSLEKKDHEFQNALLMADTITKALYYSENNTSLSSLDLANDFKETLEKVIANNNPLK